MSLSTQIAIAKWTCGKVALIAISLKYTHVTHCRDSLKKHSNVFTCIVHRAKGNLDLFHLLRYGFRCKNNALRLMGVECSLARNRKTIYSLIASYCRLLSEQKETIEADIHVYVMPKKALSHADPVSQVLEDFLMDGGSQGEWEFARSQVPIRAEAHTEVKEPSVKS